MNKAQEFLKETGGGGKGKKLTATIMVQTYDASKCSGYCPYAKDYEQMYGKSEKSTPGVVYCSLFEERVQQGKRRAKCTNIF